MPYRDAEDRRAANRRYYRRHRAKEIARNAPRREAQRARLRAAADEAKEVPCADCGGRFPPVCMDFDHTGDDKAANVANLVRDAASMKRLQAEIAKCEVVCANCHRIRTAARHPGRPQHFLALAGGPASNGAGGAPAQTTGRRAGERSRRC